MKTPYPLGELPPYAYHQRPILTLSGLHGNKTHHDTIGRLNRLGYSPWHLERDDHLLTQPNGLLQLQEQVKKAILHIFTESGDKKITLFANSFGGYLAMSIANDNYIQGKIDKIITFAPVIDPRLSLSRCMEFDTVAGCYKQDNQLLVESSRLPAKGSNITLGNIPTLIVYGTKDPIIQKGDLKQVEGSNINSIAIPDIDHPGILTSQGAWDHVQQFLQKENPPLS